MLKSIYARVDSQAEECSLHYLRTKDGQEVDFAIVKDQCVETIIEAKVSDQTLSKSLRMFHEKYQYPAIQLARYAKNEYTDQGIEKLNAQRYLSSLYL